MIKTIIKKPIELKAIQFDGTKTGKEYITKVFVGIFTLSYAGHKSNDNIFDWKVGDFDNFSYINKGDYVIKDRNSYTVCKESDFDKIYEVLNQK